MPSPIRRDYLFWLVVVCFFDDRRPSKATMYFYFIFLSFHSPPPNDSETLPPHVPPRSRALPNILPYRCRQLWVDCCVSSSNGGHLRPRPHLSLYFSMGCISAPQTGEPTAALPNPMARALHGTIGSGSAMIWWHRCWFTCLGRRNATHQKIEREVGPWPWWPPFRQ